jgi:hypothetical protein
MDIFFHILLIIVSFTIAFLGVIVLFTIDPWTGLILSMGGLLLSIRTIARA